MNISTKIGFKIEYDVKIEKCPTQELYKTTQTSRVEVCNFVMLIMNLIIHYVVARTARNKPHSRRHWVRGYFSALFKHAHVKNFTHEVLSNVVNFSFTIQHFCYFRSVCDGVRQTNAHENDGKKLFSLLSVALLVNVLSHVKSSFIT